MDNQKEKLEHLHVLVEPAHKEWLASYGMSNSYIVRRLIDDAMARDREDKRERNRKGIKSSPLFS